MYSINIYRFLLTASIAVVISLSSCSMRTVRIQATRPADVTLPSHVDTLLILNRTYFSSEAVGIIEGLLTGELPGEDRAGTQAAINAFQSTINYSNRFVVKNAAEIFPGNSISRAFPEPISWGDIENLCSKYHTNAVMAIEIYDTDFIVTDGKRLVKKEITENGVKKTVETNEFYAKGVGNVTIGFRIYDPVNKVILDQQLITQSNTWETTANSAQDALAKLIAKSDAARYVSQLAGNSYAYKIAPMPITLTRKYYKKGKNVASVATGSKQAEVNDWAAALETWKGSLLQSTSDKDAARICYNMAVAYEVLGNLEDAKLWANKAYVEYGSKKAKKYSAILDGRIYDQNRVNEQYK